MGLVDDLNAPTSDETVSRRAFLNTVTTAALGVATLGAVITSVRFLRPNVLFEPPTRFKLGAPAEIPLGQLVVLPEQRLYLLHAPEGFVAMNARCTHLGCMTRYLAEDNRIVCPCHGSSFDATGVVLEGPAPAPLQRLTLTLESGQLVVDTLKPASDDFSLAV